MARTNVTILRVLVSSPSDLEDERVALEQAIDELNRSWPSSLNVRLELVRWETHSRPGAGADPQAVINEQLADDFDIFLGMLWARLGTQTERAASGTVEEFERALSRHQRDPRSVRILVYFKNAPVLPGAIDAEQLKKVQEFKTRLGGLGILHHGFTKPEELLSHVRIHLRNEVDEWGRSWGGVRDAATTSVTAVEPEGMPDAQLELEDEGLLDLVAEAAEAMTKVQGAGQEIVRAFNTFNTRLNHHTREMQSIGAPVDLGSLKRARQIVNAAASDISELSKRLSRKTHVFSEHFLGAMDAVSRVVSLCEESGIDADDRRRFHSQLAELKSAMREALTASSVLRAAIRSWPRLTSKVAKAKREALSTFVAFEGEVASGLDAVETICSRLQANTDD